MGKGFNRAMHESHQNNFGDVTPLHETKRHHAKYNVEREKLKGKNQEQQKLINAIYEHKVVVATGPAGTGKTFPAAVIAFDMFSNPGAYEDISQIVMVRPNEPLGKTMGYMKGDLYEKYKHWLAPIEDGMLWRMEGGKVDATSRKKAREYYMDLINNEHIVPTPVEHLRGRTWNNSFVIIDEAQNLSVEAIKCIMGRIGNNSKIVLCGDLDQVDIPLENSGLRYLSVAYEYAKARYDGRVPLVWIDLVEGVRSHDCEFWTQTFNAVEDYGIMDEQMASHVGAQEFNAELYEKMGLPVAEDEESSNINHNE